MKIGTRISPDWLQRHDDLKFLKQIGVDVVDITLDICPGYVEAGGRANRAGLQQVADTLDAAGLEVERANTLNNDYVRTFRNQPGQEAEIENLQVNAELCGEFGFPIMGIQCFQASLMPDFPTEYRSWVEGRGGSQHLRFDLRTAANQAPRDDAPTHDQIWEQTLKIYEAVVPVAQQNDVRIAMHGNDPPVSSLYGIPQILTRFADFDRLFNAVPSSHNGMTFCVGTRYESGEDIFEGIRRFGEQGKIFHVHFRNVRGVIPAQQGYEEVLPDEGDLHMTQVAQALKDVGYTGALDYDHVMRLSGDGQEGRNYIAYCVGHIRGILQSLR
ncbi:MAG: mannonate dehydratase [Litorilinea sp.]